MTKKLDKKDKEILYLLSVNSRQTCTRIGKKIGLSKQNTNYRIKKLRRKGVIRKFDISTNRFLIGYHTFILFIKFQYLTKNKEDEIINFLKNQQSLTYAIRTIGNWDLFLTYIISDVPSMNNTLFELSEKYGTFIQKKEFLLVDQNYSFSLRFLTENIDSLCKISKETAKQIKLKDSEEKLIKFLKNNARISLSELSKKIKIDYKTIIKMMQRLESENYILRYNIQIDEKKIGYQDVYCLMHFDNLSRNGFQKLCQLVKNMPYAIFMITTIGRWNIILNFMVKQDEELLNDIINIKKELGNLLRGYEIIKVDYTLKH